MAPGGMTVVWRLTTADDRSSTEVTEPIRRRRFVAEVTKEDA